MARVSDDPEWRRQYHLDRYHRLCAKIIDHMGGKCVSCGSADRLEIHYRNPKEKSFEISTGWGRPWIDIEAELKKCELRCQEHHKVAHEPRHGTLSRYRLRKCRCRPCVVANSKKQVEYTRRYRQKKRDAVGLGSDGPLKSGEPGSIPGAAAN